MKRTAKTTEIDELRPEYQRSDFDELVRGKYRHGRSAEAIKDESSAQLGSRLAARFAAVSLDQDIPELRDQPARPADFES